MICLRENIYLESPCEEQIDLPVGRIIESDQRMNLDCVVLYAIKYLKSRNVSFNKIDKYYRKSTIILSMLEAEKPTKLSYLFLKFQNNDVTIFEHLKM